MYVFKCNCLFLKLNYCMCVFLHEVCLCVCHSCMSLPKSQRTRCLELLHVTAYVTKVCQSDLQLMWLD